MKIKDLQGQITKSTLLHVPPEALKLIMDKSHNLYDSRAEWEIDERTVKNIMAIGVIEPVIVTQNGDDVEIVAGRQRVKHAIEANKRLTELGMQPIRVPVMNRIGSAAELYGIMVAENEIRKEDSALSKGEKMCKLRSMGQSLQEIANTFGTSRQNVENMLIINSMGMDVKSAIKSKKLKATAALELKDLSHADRTKVLKHFASNGEKMTVSNVRRVVISREFDSADGNASSSVKSKAQPLPKRLLEKRLDILENHGYQSDRYLQSKPVDYQEGFTNALQWVLGKLAENEDFDLTADTAVQDETGGAL